ncbi:MAG: beta-galactosidase, partial [Rhodoglobus sp.]
MDETIAPRRWQSSSVLYGCDYNPEQWSRDIWDVDVALMREAGIRLVAINIFGWSTLEPRPGEYDFEGLDAIIELLHANGIAVNLGTGTSSPPAWLTTRNPEILPVLADGTTRWPGGRQAWCPSSPVFRAEAFGLVAKVAERYAAHPGVALWHVSNELGCHNALCYCDVSAAAFRRWLETRYRTIDALNDAWGTSFWSQRYGAWEEILPPRATLSAGNPGQRLDFARFSSDELLDYYRGEADILRAASSAPVTTNFMVTAHIRSQDYWQWASDMDVIANDHYLDSRLPHPTSELSFAADLTRGLAAGEPWMLMESSTGAVSWQPRNLAKAPGQMLRNSLTHVARGADAVCFFQWRASRQGAEKFHSALLPHAGIDSTAWRETLELGAALEAITEVAGSRVDASVALVFSWQSWWATEGDSQPSSDVRYLDEVHAAYEALRASGVTVDVVAPGSDLSGYRVVVVPCLYLVSDDAASSISAFVAAGGTALVTYFSGVTDESDRIRMDPTGATTPGAFSAMLGAWTEEYFPLLPAETRTLSAGSAASRWTEIVRPTTAETVESFVDAAVVGSPAITRNGFGAGVAWYVATALDEPSFATLVARVLAEAGVTGAGDSEFEVVSRSSDAGSWLFAINHSAESRTLDATGTELLTGAVVAGSLTIPAGAVRVVRMTAER